MPLLGETRCHGYRVYRGGAERAFLVTARQSCSNAARFINAALEF